MTRAEKIDLLWNLEDRGVGRQHCPEHDGRGGVKYWPFQVLQPGNLPKSLKLEYERLGELRW